jgi:hypothetical protein
MKTKSVFIIPLMIVLMLSLVSCTKPKTEGSLLAKGVALMEIDPQSTSKVIYGKDKNSRN